MIDAALRQPLPIGDGDDVAKAVVSVLSNWPETRCLVADIEARVASGEKKYGTRLKTNNGRNAVLDLYQEILDGVNYSMQNVMEKAPQGLKAAEPYDQLFRELVGLSVRVKALLNAQEEAYQNTGA